MRQNLVMHFEISGTDFSLAGQASSQFKKVMKQLGLQPEIIRKAAVSMYEGEINTVIHGKGGICDIEVSPEQISITFTDHGPGICDVALAMQEGFSTATEEARELGFGAGMGLPNMKKYSDKMHIDTSPEKGTTVNLVIDLK